MSECSKFYPVETQLSLKRQESSITVFCHCEEARKPTKQSRVSSLYSRLPHSPAGSLAMTKKTAITRWAPFFKPKIIPSRLCRGRGSSTPPFFSGGGGLQKSYNK